VLASLEDSVRHFWGKGIFALRRIARDSWFYPASLLLMGLLVYGYALPGLGYFWDDWEVVFLLHAGDPALFAGYFAFDRPFAWPYQLMYAMFGLNPVAWHLATLVLRVAGIVFLYLALRIIWPKFEPYLRWLGALMLFYPGYLQQPISAAYNRHFSAFCIFGASIFLMVLAARRPAQAWWMFPLSWTAAFLQVFTIEYFVGLELVRPVLLWFAVPRREDRNAGGHWIRVILLSLPYIAILGFFFWWRLVVFPGTISVTNYAGDFKLLQDFGVSWISGALAVLTRGFLDLIFGTLQVWWAPITGSQSATFQSKIAWFAFAVGTGLAFFFTQSQARLEPEDDTFRQSSLRSVLVFGAWAFVAAGLPVWLTSKQLSAGGRWDDRFSLAPMLGAILLVLVLIWEFVRPRRHRLLLASLLALSVATQVLVVNKYRLDWAVQNAYYWQLAWRVPSLAPQTAVLSLEQPSESIPGYDASFALNILLGGEIEDGNAPYWFFTNDRFLNFDFKPGQRITYRDRNLRFSGNTSDAIAIVHQGQDRCLQVLDEPYSAEPFYTTNQERLVAVSNVNRILPVAQLPPPSALIFGPEPSHEWCYYFEKADLARQLGEWDGAILLWREARAAGFGPRFGPEYLPFIEAYARSGDWQQAFSLSKAAQASISEMEPLLCETWARLGTLPGVDSEISAQAAGAFECGR
jgi:hypothetical protein